MRRRAVPILVAIAMASAIGVPPAYAAGPGSLDTTFGGGSGYKELLVPGATASTFYAVATVGSKIVAAGVRDTATDTTFLVARMRASGAPDPTFSGDGVATVNLSAYNEFAQSVLPMPDGRVLAVGYMYAGAGSDSGRFALVMYRANGTLDPHFGGDGKVITRFPHWPAFAYTAALQPDGKIVVGGELFKTSTHNGMFAFARYRPNGKLDPTFGGDGRVTVNILKKDDGAWTVRVRPNGKIVAAGWSSRVYPYSWRTSMAQLKPNGKLDPTFSGDGKATFDVMNTHNNYGLGLVLRPRGKSLVSVDDNANTGPEVIEVTRGGHMNMSFGGGDGVANYSRASAYSQTLALQDDGKPVVIGVDNNVLALFRFTKAGKHDTGYGTNGETTLAVPSYGYGITIDGSGRAVAVGSQGGANVTARFLG